MQLIVTDRDLRWQGKRLRQGETFTANTDRELKLVDLLKKIGKVADGPPAKPVGKTTSVQPPPAPKPEPASPPEPTPEPAPDPEPVAPLSTDDAPAITPRRGGYQTRRLKAED